MTNILIIEDEEDIRLLLRLSMRSEPYDIIEASSGQEAAEQWASADLILLDIGLPDTDGVDLVRKLGDGQTPVIALSAHSGGDVRAAALGAGCVDYLTKPFTTTELLVMIRSHLPAVP